MVAKARRACIIVLVCATALLPFLRTAHANDLSEAFLLPELFEVMAAEGRTAIGEEGAAPLSSRELDIWRTELAGIYDTDQMLAAFVDALEQALEPMPDVRDDAIRFATTELGQRIMRLEVSARAALLDDEVDEMARLALLDARASLQDTDGAHRLAMIRDRIAVNDLIELNVSLGMNTSYAYYRGMLAEGASAGYSAEDLLNLVQAMQPDIRRDVVDWIESYFLMAYQPLSDAELQDYIDYSASPQGVAFNRAMFQAFDAVFVGLSGRVGRALGRILGSDTL
ncbi:MAG: hypothetical protein JJU08_03775 [Rhodobacteraceae bacterium]|nr:hypothetical protein [Paracoccaceae bacterium]